MVNKPTDSSFPDSNRLVDDTDEDIEASAATYEDELTPDSGHVLLSRVTTSSTSDQSHDAQFNPFISTETNTFED